MGLATLYIKVINSQIFLNRFARFHAGHISFIFLAIKKRLWWSWSCWIYNYLCNQWLSPLMLWVRIPLRRGVFDITLCDKVCQWFTGGQWFSPGTPVSSTNKADHHDITEILLKVALNTINHHKQAIKNSCPIFQTSSLLVFHVFMMVDLLNKIYYSALNLCLYLEIARGSWWSDGQGRWLLTINLTSDVRLCLSTHFKCLKFPAT